MAKYTGLTPLGVLEDLEIRLKRPFGWILDTLFSKLAGTVNILPFRLGNIYKGPVQTSSTPQTNT